MCDLENSDPNDVSRPSVSPTDWRLFLAGALALTLATIPANVELAEAQAAWGVSINPEMVGSFQKALPESAKAIYAEALITWTRQGIPCFLRSVSPG